MINNKPVISIDIDEIIRSKWIQFDRMYVQEFGEEGVPEEEYVFDYFKYYKWSDGVEKLNILKEEIPDISPKDYQLDENGESLADSFLFKKEERKYTAKEQFEKFMYEDYVFEIFGAAPQMYRGLDLHLNQFKKEFGKYKINIVSKENEFTIPPTLFFLSKSMVRFKNYIFYDNYDDYWNDCDILITTNPYLIENKPENKIVIKMNRPYNKNIKCDYEFIQLYDMINDDNIKKVIYNYGK